MGDCGHAEAGEEPATERPAYAISAWLCSNAIVGADPRARQPRVGAGTIVPGMVLAQHYVARIRVLVEDRGIIILQPSAMQRRATTVCR